MAKGPEKPGPFYKNSEKLTALITEAIRFYNTKIALSQG